MKKLLTLEEREKLRSTYRTHPLLSASYKVFTGRMGHFKSLEVQPEDVFREVVYLLDFFLSDGNVNQRMVDGLWTLLVNDIRKWKPDAHDEDKMLMAGTVFLMVKKILCHHCEERYCGIVHGMLEDTLERNLKIYDEQEHQQFLARLSECSVLLSEWINKYDDEGDWLSDQITDTLEGERGTTGKNDFRPSGKTFSKTALLTDKLIDIIGLRLAKANKLNASPDNFRKLFSGVDQQFTMTWLGTGGELRDLFKMLTNDGYTIPKRGYQQILKSHFLDEGGNRFNNLHGDKSIDDFQTIIDDCAFLLQHLTDSMTVVMKQLISENKDALSEVGYFDRIQSAKQSGLSIRNKRR